MDRELERGRVVVSLAGRDEGQTMAVLRAQGAAVWVADGKRRPLERPKRKNARHVAAVASRLEEPSMATNRELRRALAREAQGLSGRQRESCRSQEGG